MKEDEIIISKIKRRDDAIVIGKKFGKLKVIKYVYSKKKQRYFECLCECGNKKNVSKSLLKFGSVKSCGCSKTYQNLEEIFRTNTQQNGECLEWIGHKTREGYGRFTFQGKTNSAHRAQWERNMGEIPQNYIICHHCDNRACVKIEHLFLALPSSNSKDMVRKKRQARGSKNGSSKLNEKAVKQILQASEEIPIRKLAEKYGVNNSAIRRVLNRETWSHVSTFRESD